jgi:hypothetical protein
MPFHISAPIIVRNPSLQVGEFLISEGISLASEEGDPISDLADRDCLGILYQNGSLLKPKFIGIVWFNNPAQGANEYLWVVQYFDPKFKEMNLNILTKILEKFKVHMTARFIENK